MLTWRGWIPAFAGMTGLENRQLIHGIGITVQKVTLCMQELRLSPFM
jgi:hypothetical protein